MAAVLAAGKDAVLSHATAATAWNLRPPGAGAIHVTVPGNPRPQTPPQASASTAAARSLQPTPPPTTASRSPAPSAPSSTSPPPSKASHSSKRSTAPTIRA